MFYNTLMNGSFFCGEAHCQELLLSRLRRERRMESKGRSLLDSKNGHVVMGVCFVLLCLLGIFSPIQADEPRVESLIIRLRSGSSLQSGGSPMSQLKTMYPNAKIWEPKLKSTTTGLSAVVETVLMELPEGADPEAMSQLLSEQSWVSHAEPNYPVVAMGGGDPLRYLQAHLYTNRLTALDSFIAHQEVLVAVLDSGIDYYHPDLKDQVHVNSQEVLTGTDSDNNGFVDDIYGYDFYGFYRGNGGPNPNDGLGHGTHISGIIAAKDDNAVGISGIAPYVKLLNVRFLDDRGYGNQYDAAFAIHYAVDNGAKIINCSWGYFKSTSVLDEAIAYALDHGVIVVASAGNSGTSVAEYPAAYPGVIAVGAVTLADTKTYFSSYGKVDTAMYGDEVYSTLPNNSYGRMSGTSQSAGVVTGILARLWAHFPAASPETVRQHYFQACTNPDEASGVGQGMFSTQSLYANLSYDPGTYSQSDTPVTPIDVSRTVSVQSASLQITNLYSFPNPHVTTTAYIGFESTHVATVTVKIFSLEGRLLRTLDSVGSPGYNRIPWDLLTDTGDLLRNGSYLYVLTAKSGDQTETMKGKFAVLL
jgi:hypothetical protein